MPGKFVLTLMVACSAAVAVLWRLPSRPVSATGTTPLCDDDGDFLPDAVEWAVLTNGARADTDGDEVPDFVEVIEFGQPRTPSPLLPPDNQMRVVVSGPAVGASDSLAWLHVFYRIMSGAGGPGGALAAIQSFDSWLELPCLPGLRIPLNSLGVSGLVVRERATGAHGDWVQISIPLIEPQVLAMILPCTIWVESVVDGGYHSNGVTLFEAEDEIATLVPFRDGDFVMQNLSRFTDPGGGTGSNRVCVLQLGELYSGPGGTTYQVTGADCEDCNELECGQGCLDSVGLEITIPGGLEMISH